jgi:phosphoribosylamine--glycine ligase
VRILLIGSGGREHALAWKLSQSPLVEEIHAAPGNGGTAQTPKTRNVPIAAGQVKELIAYALEQKLDFVVPGPELPLVNGVGDACARAGLPCFGPDAYCAQLEGSKVFSKEIMAESGVPTASSAIFASYEQAAAYVKAKDGPVVIKADGLASGKGVIIAASAAEALKGLSDLMLEKTLGAAAGRVLLEETLQGEEISLLAFCDGERAVPLPSAQDHKRVFDNDKGPNTGGMGAYSPTRLLPAEKLAEICELTITPILRTMKAHGHPFKGVLYAGLMYTPHGVKVLEYNVRFGDPECQPLLMRLAPDCDLMEIMLACVRGGLDGASIAYRPENALCVVMSAKDYPGSYPRGLPVSGLEEAERAFPERLKVFHAGTALKDGRTVSNGGRVLGVTALGKNLREAQATAYAAMKMISMPDSHYRLDIGNKGLNRD